MAVWLKTANRKTENSSSFRLYRSSQASGRRSQVVRQRSAKPLFIGSIPIAASNLFNNKKSKLLAFSMTDEEYAQIERMALVVGEDQNNWCRNIIVAQASEGSVLTKTQRLLYEEIARVRYLVGNGFRLLLSSNEASAAT